MREWDSIEMASECCRQGPGDARRANRFLWDPVVDEIFDVEVVDQAKIGGSGSPWTSASMAYCVGHAPRI